MAYNVNLLPDYVEQHKGELLSKAVLGFETRKYVALMPGVKDVQALNIYSSEAILQERNCGFDASGNTTFSQRNMLVGHYKLNKEWCPDDLESKWMQSELITRAGGEVLPFEEKETNEVIKGVNDQLEKLVWNASTGNGDLFNGFLTIADAEADTIDVSKGATDYETAKEVYKNIPINIIDKAEMFCGKDMFLSIVDEITAKNLYHYAPVVDEAFTLTLPGTVTKLHGVAGLNRTGRIYAADPENMIYGFDVEADKDTFKIWYSDDNQKFRGAIKFNAGVQVAFPDEIVVSEAE